ncbi:MAG: hypothetical protein ACLFWM_14270 [Actinomycetota bacterium]
MLDDPAFTALAVIGAVGAVAGLVGGVLAGARRLVGTILMGTIGAIAAAAIARIAGAPPFYAIGDGFSYVYGIGGSLLLSYIVGRNDRP